MALTERIVQQQQQVLSAILARVDDPRWASLIRSALPEPHYEELFHAELQRVYTSERWRTQLATALLNGACIARWAARRDGVPIVRGLAGASFAESEPPVYSPALALEYWKNTIPLTDDEVEGLRENLNGFFNSTLAIAGDYTQSVMTEVGRIFAAAIAEGMTISEFRRRFAEVVPGKARALAETIFRTNITRAYGAQRYAEIRGAGMRVPFIQYLSIPDDRRTAICEAMYLYVAASTDPIWLTWVPPNHWRCRSDLSPIGYLEAIRLGLAAYTSDRRGLVLLRGARPYGDPPAFTFDRNRHAYVRVEPYAGFGVTDKSGVLAA
jgi:SPP1 gp7 family putative phage head morphogenesis protein